MTMSFASLPIFTHLTPHLVFFPANGQVSVWVGSLGFLGCPSETLPLLIFLMTKNQLCAELHGHSTSYSPPEDSHCVPDPPASVPKQEFQVVRTGQKNGADQGKITKTTFIVKKTGSDTFSYHGNSFKAGF